MRLLTPSSLQKNASSNENQIGAFDPKNIAYLRLLSAVLEKPVDSLARQLNASEAAVSAQSHIKDHTAA